MQAQTTERWYQECCGVTTITRGQMGAVATLLVGSGQASMAAVSNSVLPCITLCLVLPEKALLIFSLLSRSQVDRSGESEVNVAVFWASVRFLTLVPWLFSSEFSFFSELGGTSGTFY